MNYGEAQRYWIWLSSIPGVGVRTFERLMTEYGEAKYVWDQMILAKRLLTPRIYEQIRSARTDEYMDQLFIRMEEEGISAVTQLDDEYPDRLRGIENAPPTLFVRGNTDLNDEKMFAIVGSRKITADGMFITEKIARELAEKNITIVSGLALGADRRAHEGCLQAGGKTIAVVASGPEIVYPAEHRGLVERILENGGTVLSEYPPGVAPEAKHFPQRNRIISGMSDGVLMTEGSVKSGAMITVKFARSQRRPCFAVPGSVLSSASEGPNRMLVDGDRIALSAEQILDYFGWDECREEDIPEAAPLPELDEESQKLVDILRFEEKSFDELVIDMKMNSSSLNSLLTILEMQGIIRQSAGKLYRALV